MNTEDSEFARLEREALLRASQPEHQVQPVPLAAHQASYHPALYRNYPTDVLDALHDAFMALPPCPLFGVISNALQEIQSLRQVPLVQPVQSALSDIEQYRLQMAGISTAAFGYWKKGDPIHPDYLTVALDDVADLYQKYDALFQKNVAQPVQSPQCVWKWLTDEEIDNAKLQVILSCDQGELERNGRVDDRLIYHAIIAALMEKNT